MIIERRLTPYLVFHDESVVVALRKMTGNAERIVFVVDGTGQLLGSLTDGDFRRWIVAHPEADLEVAVQQVANPHPATVGPEATEEQMRAALPAGASHLPVLDERGRITAIAIDRPPSPEAARAARSARTRPIGRAPPGVATTSPSSGGGGHLHEVWPVARDVVATRSGEVAAAH